MEALIGRQNFATYKASPFWIDMQEAWEKLKVRAARAQHQLSVLSLLAP